MGLEAYVTLNESLIAGVIIYSAVLDAGGVFQVVVILR